MGLSPVVLYNACSFDLASYCPSDLLSADNIAPNVSYETVASSLLLKSLLKKWTYKNTKDADAACYEKFLASNKKCENWSLVLSDDSDKVLYGLFRSELDNFLHPQGGFLIPSYFDILENGRTGPGSSIGATGNSFYAKLFSSTLTCTSPSLYKMYSTYANLFPEFSNAESFRYGKFGAATYVSCSRSSFVPKSQDISRLICTEPSLNMFFQLGLGTMIERHLLRRFNTSFKDQPDINRLLARQGSIDGSYSTIDLSSASDSISINLCREIFPDWFYNLLVELRSPRCRFGSDTVTLNMISTMGNGYTFPLQTLIFSCLIRAAYRSVGIPIDDELNKNWACFGDDIIVRDICFPAVTRLLGILGFELNNTKTFNTGHFRESCGNDWFYGQSVRGVYIRKLTSIQDIFVAINLLNEWSSETGIPLSKTIGLLLSEVPRNKIFYVPYDEANDAGIRIPSSLIPKVSRDRNGSYIYRVFRSKPKRIRIGDGTISVPSGHKKLIYNPSGLLLAFLHGEIASGTIMVRQSQTLYRTKRRCTPFWDYLPTFALARVANVNIWQRWEHAVLLNHLV